MWKYLVVIALLSLLGTTTNVARAASPAPACLNDRSPDRLRNCALALEKDGKFAQATLVMQRATDLNPSAANWRYLGELAARAENFETACTAFTKATAMYGKLDPQAALFLKQTKSGYCQQAQFYTLEGTPAPPPKLAKFEPPAGLLLGLSAFPDALRANGGKLPALEQLGGPLAVYLTYYPLIDPATASSNLGVFPREVAQAAREAGAALHLALEPKMPLSSITEATLTPFALAARDAELPIFLRFAGEFNDPVNAWSRDPALYVQKFRLIHDVMARVAPNVAMVWMPMANGTDCLTRYFPGDAYVDWVGVSLYSVPFLNGDSRFSGENYNPLEQVSGIYNCYSARHPVQVSEYASSSRTVGLGDADYCDFATRKLRELFWGAALKLPRLKNINWLDLDMGNTRQNISKGASRQNDYRLLEVPCKLEAFKGLLREPYFLERLNTRLSTAPAPFPVLAKVGMRGAAYLRLAAPLERVDHVLDGKPLSSATVAPFGFTLPLNLKVGNHSLELRAVGKGGKLLLSKVQQFAVK